MKPLLIIIFCSILASCGVEKNKTEFEKIIIDNQLNSNLFNSTDSILNPLTLKTKSSYDNVPDSSLYIVNSNAIVNNDKHRLMRFSKLTQIDLDTLNLKIFETNPLYSQSLEIIIAGDEFKMEFDYNMSGPPINTRIKRLKQELILKSYPKSNGEIIFGKFYFKGICESDCDEEIEIIGDFKASLE